MERRRQKILLVDDNAAILTVGRNMLKPFYEVHLLSSAEMLFECLERLVPDMILLDTEMPGMSGCEAVKLLKSVIAFIDIPVIFLTAEGDDGIDLEWLNLGVVDYLSKPFSAPLLLERIRTHLLLASQKKKLKMRNHSLQTRLMKKNRQVAELKNAVLGVVSELVECRDRITAGHVSRTQKYLQFMIDRLLAENVYTREIAAWDLEFLLPSSQLHDVGKIAISDTILNKPGRLTRDEFEKMKAHVTIGVEAIERIEEATMEHDFLRHAKVFAGTHHERWDGTGYPWGLCGKNIPLEGRLMAIADVYDALTSERPYKKPYTTAEAEKIIEAGKGSQFDPVLVDVFHRTSGRFEEVANQRGGPNLSEPQNSFDDDKILMFTREYAANSF